VRITKIIPASSAALSELAVGDVLLALNGAAIDSLPTFFSTIKAFKLGDQITCRVHRSGKELNINVTLKEWPREQAKDIEVLYDVVDTKEAKLRSILTKPIGKEQKLPAILFIQGTGCASIDWPLAEADHQRDLTYGLTRAGFVVMRSEKSGVGDSTGSPCLEVGLQDEVTGFTSALQKLKTYDFVDSQNIFLFGYSTGGLATPLVAATESVSGIVVYGTVVRPFAEYLVDNHRRNQWLRFQPDLVQLEETQHQMAQLLHYLLVEKHSVSEVTNAHPELTAIVTELFPQNDEHLYGLKSLRYFRELNDQNFARVWASLNIPVLALVGEYDIRTLALDHEYLAAIINTRHPGKGTWLQLPKMDHGFALHQSLTESATHEFTGPFGEQVVHETVKWMQEVATKPIS
jgi:pimeloyl-ACP methyl ester carboxylesterase